MIVAIGNRANKDDDRETEQLRVQLTVELSPDHQAEDWGRELHDIKALARNFKYLLEDIKAGNPFNGPWGMAKLATLESSIERSLHYLNLIEELIVAAHQIGDS